MTYFLDQASDQDEPKKRRARLHVHVDSMYSAFVWAQRIYNFII